MAGSSNRRKRWGVLAALAIFVVLLAVALAVVLVIVLLRPGSAPGPGPVPPVVSPPDAQSADCPDVQLISVPGTWESSVGDDPLNPIFNPASLMLNITNPIKEKFAANRVSVYTIAYPAQFSNPLAFPPDGQQSYNSSRSAGLAEANRVISATHARCPLTSFILAGFSQGAVIAGDIASNIGSAVGPIPQELVLGVGLIADGRRDPAAAENVGPSPEGVGAELALGGLRVPGITMTGKRPGGFGSLTGRTREICAAGDLICAAPNQALSLTNIPGSLATLVAANGNPVHAMYNTTNYWQLDGQSATSWMQGWFSSLLDSAPRPRHE
ncbi:MAG: cutinase family protein [Mycobacteriaceae bacterium]